MTSTIPETQKVFLPALVAGEKPLIEDAPVPKPGENQVLVQVEFAPLHYSDILALKGHTRALGMPAYPCGVEGSGIVVALGTSLKVPHKIGEKVFIAEPGTYSKYVVADSEKVQLIPEGLSLEDAAGQFVNPSTVYALGTLAEGHKAAIHTVGSSTIGRMLIRYFKQKGIKLINIVRKEEYIEELKAEGADYVLNSEAPGFEERLKELAEKENATVAFDPINGDSPNKILKAQPPKSICYVYGALSGFTTNKIDIMELFKGKAVSGFLIYNHLAELAQKEGELAKFFEGVNGLLRTVFYSQVQKTFSVTEMDEAIAFYKENSSKGKILLKPN